MLFSSSCMITWRLAPISKRESSGKRVLLLFGKQICNVPLLSFNNSGDLLTYIFFPYRDNRVTQHSALIDWKNSQRRHLARITPQAERPFETPFKA